MAIHENVFTREFKEMMNSRKSMQVDFNVNSIQVPQVGLITKADYVKDGVMSNIKGIAEPYFDKLNNTRVEAIKDKVVKKRMSMYDENNKIVFRKDKNGKFVTQDIQVKKGFVAIYSSVNIHLPNRTVVNDVKKEYKPTDGYRYVDVVSTIKGPKYMYIVPMESVYPIELCALVIALNKHRAYYKGCKLALTNGHYVHIYTIPYKYRENAGYKLIGLKASTNMSEEIKAIFNFWYNQGIMFEPSLTKLDEQVKGITNLGIEDLVGTLDIFEYKVTKGPLKEMEFEVEGE